MGDELFGLLNKEEPFVVEVPGCWNIIELKGFDCSACAFSAGFFTSALVLGTSGGGRANAANGFAFGEFSCSMCG